MVYRVLEYLLLFVILVLLQIFLFNGINLSVYITPLVYIAFVAMLPMNIMGVLMLILAFGLGILMDVSMGTAGINTIATLFTAFCRPVLLAMVVGKEEVKEGGAPTLRRLGFDKYARYIIILTVIQCFVFFTFESLTWDYYHLTLLRIALSAVVTAVIIFFFQLLFSIKG